MFPVPIPRRLSDSNNGKHFSITSLNLPIGIGDLEDDHKRLEMCQTAYSHPSDESEKCLLLCLLFSPVDNTWLISKCLLPIPLGPLTTWPIVILDSFPGPRSILTINGYAVLDVHFNCLGGQGQFDHKGIGFCVLLYDTRFQLVVNAGRTKFPTETLLQEFANKLPVIFETMQNKLLTTKYLPSKSSNGNDASLLKTV